MLSLLAAQVEEIAALKERVKDLEARLNRNSSNASKHASSDKPFKKGPPERRRAEVDSLWVFLLEQGVSPTNNHAERMLRYAVLWRKRSQGTSSDKGDRRVGGWVERIPSLRQTSRLQSQSTFCVLSDALRCHFKGQQPDLTWIAQA